MWLNVINYMGKCFGTQLKTVSKPFDSETEWLLKALRWIEQKNRWYRCMSLYHWVYVFSIVVGIYRICDVVRFYFFFRMVSVCISDDFASTCWIQLSVTQESVEQVPRHQGRCFRCQVNIRVFLGHQMGGCDYSMFKLIWNGSFCFGCTWDLAMLCHGLIWSLPFTTGHRMDAT